MTELYIENFDRDLNESQLRRAFELYGTVEKVSIIAERKPWMERVGGVAFVTMPNDREAILAANSLSGCNFCYSRVFVRPARLGDHEVRKME